jgi:hypothetical protein
MFKKSFVVIVFLFSGCASKKTEDDFIGKYKSFYAAKIDLGNSVSGFLFGGSTKPTAKSFNDLGEITLELSLGKDGIQGEESIVIKKSQNESFTPSETNIKMSFDLANFHISGDTLFFSLSNQLLSLQGKKYFGSVVKNKSGVLLGFDRVNVGIDSTEGPFDAGKAEGILYLKCLEKDRVIELGKNYFKEQERQLTSKLSNEHNDNKRIILKNSLEEVRRLTSLFSY